MKLKNNTDLEGNKGYEWIEQGKYMGAVKFYDKILELDSKYYGGGAYHGRVCVDTRNWCVSEGCRQIHA